MLKGNQFFEKITQIQSLIGVKKCCEISWNTSTKGKKVDIFQEVIVWKKRKFWKLTKSKIFFIFFIKKTVNFTLSLVLNNRRKIGNHKLGGPASCTYSFVTFAVVRVERDSKQNNHVGRWDQPSLAHWRCLNLCVNGAWENDEVVLLGWHTQLSVLPPRPVKRGKRTFGTPKHTTWFKFKRSPYHWGARQ